MCEKITLSVDGLTMRMMKYKRVNTNIMHRQRSEHGPTWWWCLQVKCQTIQHFLQLNIPFDLLDRLPFWLCDLPRLISHNQYLVCSSGRKIYYAVRIGCVWEKRDQRALLLYGLSKNSVKQQAIRLHWCRTLINLTLILTHHIASEYVLHRTEKTTIKSNEDCLILVSQYVLWTDLSFSFTEHRILKRKKEERTTLIITGTLNQKNAIEWNTSWVL